MQQELTEIAKHGQIDQETGRRLEACMDSEFRSSPIRYFGARKVIIVTGASELLSIAKTHSMKVGDKILVLESRIAQDGTERAISFSPLNASSKICELELIQTIFKN